MLITEYFNGNKIAQVKKYNSGYTVSMFENEKLLQTVSGLPTLEEAETIAENFTSMGGGEPVLLNE